MGGNVWLDRIYLILDNSGSISINGYTKKQMHEIHRNNYSLFGCWWVIFNEREKSMFRAILIQQKA